MLVLGLLRKDVLSLITYWLNELTEWLLPETQHCDKLRNCLSHSPSLSSDSRSVAVFIFPQRLFPLEFIVDTLTFIPVFVRFNSVLSSDDVYNWWGFQLRANVWNYCELMQYVYVGVNHQACSQSANCCMYGWMYCVGVCSVKCLFVCEYTYVCVCACDAWVSGCPGFADGVYPSCSMVGISPLIQSLLRGSLS